ncbi:NUDIX domain-containing protein [Hyphobacterium marinum]|uniref:NUDIX domain-containing protein n=1 Tax=Hyphobacterium marinum TaxID=3116574 RepID=A0ABU7LZ59_9PROT|nr:NUDIX domain-containing protein [Hyphobacterium sp. Y6023]MEE2566823.1 NUDIX domain-containing protein [Hyphobacterium sp. Y6023]
MTLRPKFAGSLLLTRGAGEEMEVLMGRRSSAHAFMPQRYVFPGGRVDRADHFAAYSGDLDDRSREAMETVLSERRARAIAVAAIRETAEETGHLIARRGQMRSRHAAWEPFREAGAKPDLSGLTLIARAITPPGRVRRFDAWFFRADISSVMCETGACSREELEDVRWVDLQAARKLELPKVTHFVLGELERHIADPEARPRHIRELARKVRLDTL